MESLIIIILTVISILLILKLINGPKCPKCNNDGYGPGQECPLCGRTDTYI